MWGATGNFGFWGASVCETKQHCSITLATAIVLISEFTTWYERGFLFKHFHGVGLGPLSKILAVKG